MSSIPESLIPLVKCIGESDSLANPFYHYTTSITYKGNVVSGKADGMGYAVWMYNEDTIMVYQGTFTRGRMNGLGKAKYPMVGMIYEGEWEYGAPLGVTKRFYSGLYLNSYKIDKDTASTEDFTWVEVMPTIDLTAMSNKLIYPRAARYLEQEQLITMSCLVSKNGYIKKIKAVGDEHVYPMLCMSACFALLEAPITPAVLDGKKADCWISVPVRFNLK